MKVIEKYYIDYEGVDFYVEILGEDKPTEYHIFFRPAEKATEALINGLKKELVAIEKFAPEKVVTHEDINALKDELRKDIDAVLKDKFKKIFRGDEAEAEMNYIKAILVSDMLGLGKIDIILADDMLEEIDINCYNEPVRVFSRTHQAWLNTNITIDREDKIKNLASRIGRRAGRDIDVLNPILDADLKPTEDRVNAMLDCIAPKGTNITIRRFVREPWTVIDFIKNKTCPAKLFAFIWLAIEYEGSILISGGTASGKTSLLNVLMPFITPHQKIISIEQTKELQLPKFLFWSPLVARLPNPEGRGEVTMFDLIIASLRKRPDRVVVGEVRRKEEINTLFQAINTGHSVYSTIHAYSVEETIERLAEPPMSISPVLINTIDLNVLIHRDRRRGIRRIAQIGEFIVEKTEASTSVKENIIYGWNPRKDTWEMNNRSEKMFERLQAHTGLSIEELEKDIKIKEKILNWMVENKKSRIDDVGIIMKEYYDNKEKFLEKYIEVKKIEKKKTKRKR